MYLLKAFLNQEKVYFSNENQLSSASNARPDMLEKTGEEYLPKFTYVKGGGRGEEFGVCFYSGVQARGYDSMNKDWHVRIQESSIAQNP